VPENTLTYTVGLLLATLGTCWTVEGAGFLVSGESLEWPGARPALSGGALGAAAPAAPAAPAD
jgi:uncharacterized membrane protein